MKMNRLPILAAGVLLAAGVEGSAWAQGQGAAGPAAAAPSLDQYMFTNLTVVAVLLLLTALALMMLTAGLGYAAVRNRRLDLGEATKVGTLVLGFVLTFSSLSLHAQAPEVAEAATEAAVSLSQQSIQLMVRLIYGLIALNLLFVLFFLLTLNYYLKVVHGSSLSVFFPTPRFGFQWLFGLRKSGRGKQVMDQDLGHEYDGITELDNAAPPLFVYILYGTIIYAVIHLSVFHVFKVGVLQEEQLRNELAKAEIEKARYAQFAANRVDENSVQLLTDASALEEGKKVYLNSCAACHGQAGEGNVGPNLTDAYWLHGGGIKNVFKTVKYGVPEKGMIAWEKQLSPAQIAQVSSYILSMQGTNPPNAKAPQGELWTGEESSSAGAEATDGKLSDQSNPSTVDH